MNLLGQTPTPSAEQDPRTPLFWAMLILLAILACLLIYGIFETRLRLAAATGAAALEVLRRNSRRLWILIAGTSVIVFGILIAPLPGPGPVLLVPVGFGILATEFAWARKLQQEIGRRTTPLQNAARHVVDRTPRWIVVPALLIYWCVPAALNSFTSIQPGAVWSVAGALFGPFILWAWMVYRTGTPSLADGSQEEVEL
ncbi:MAG: PGPGW domain-containing protein [Phycisphaerales bacterium]